MANDNDRAKRQREPDSEQPPESRRGAHAELRSTVPVFDSSETRRSTACRVDDHAELPTGTAEEPDLRQASDVSAFRGELLQFDVDLPLMFGDGGAGFRRVPVASHDEDQR